VSKDKSGVVDFQGLALKIGGIFRPSTPIDSEKLFCGRTVQVRDVVDAINQPGRHAILYGEAGVGKTSLGNILQTKLRSINEVPIFTALVTCDSSDTFSSIWNKAFEALDVEGYGLSEVEETDDGEPVILVTESPQITPNEVRKVLNEYGKNGILYVIIDEFDKISDDQCRKMFADTVKLLSDRAVPATVIMIGVSDDVTGLIKDHGSIQRCLAQVHMPRMRREELEEIVRNGMRSVGMTVDDTVLLEISGLSKGLPNYAHMLALYAGRHSLDRQSLKVASEDLEYAVSDSIRQAQESIRTNYYKATNSVKRGTLFEDVLLACSMAECDEFGWFQPANICEPLHKVTGEDLTTDRFAVHLKAFCEDARGPVLVRSGGDYRWKYRFKDPMMQPFVIMKGLATQKIKKDALNLLRDPNGQNRFNF
jgi:Cdc6-like AAA superfamily ATPase